MSNWKPVLAIVLVFIAGLVLGTVGTRMVVARDIRQMVANPGIVRDRVELQLVRRLRLNPMQRRQINQILVRTTQQLRQTRLEVQPRIAAITSNAQAEIDGILTPEQQRAFERLREENRPLLGPLLGPPPPVRNQ